MSSGELTKQLVQDAIASGKVVDVYSIAKAVREKYPQEAPFDELASLVSEIAIGLGASAWWRNYPKSK